VSDNQSDFIFHLSLPKYESDSCSPVSVYRYPHYTVTTLVVSPKKNTKTGAQSKINYHLKNNGRSGIPDIITDCTDIPGPIESFHRVHSPVTACLSN